MAALLALLAACAILTGSHALDIRVTKTKNVTIPSTIYGYMWEDINHSGDGGLYAELLQNRAFQVQLPGTAEALTAWNATGGATLTVVNDTSPVSSALPNSLRVDVPTGTTGAAGALNTGYWGIKVQKGWKYTGTFYAKSSSFSGTITAALKSADGKTTFASKTLSGVGKNWKKFEYTLEPSFSASGIDNVFSVTVDAKKAAGKTVYFGLFTLFPPTWNNRPNGMRIDIAQAFAETKPGLWRLGGNNLEGTATGGGSDPGGFNNRWKWNETLGPLENRPGRWGNWGYPNTDGLGLIEYLDFIQDLGAEPILGIWDGIVINDYANLSGWPVVPEDQLQPYIDDAINEIEFIIGDAKTTKYGALRASLGRKKPYQLRYIEIGNEDQFQEPSYQAYRWNMFVTQIGAKYPQLEFLATSYPSLALDPPYHKIDYHQYQTPDWFETAAFMFDWDNYPRNGTQYFVGEYAVTSTNDSDPLGTFDTGRLRYPTLQGASAEAAFMTGMERNADVVFASAYAPSLQHIDSYQWTPDIMTFDAGSVVRSISYYVQKLFSTNKGTNTLITEPISSPETAPLYWVASIHNKTNVVYLKVSNAGNATISTTVSLDFTVKGNKGIATILSGPDAAGYNTLDNPNYVTPKNQTVSIVGGSFTHDFPPMSVAVFQFPTKG